MQTGFCNVLVDVEGEEKGRNEGEEKDCTNEGEEKDCNDRAHLPVVQ